MKKIFCFSLALLLGLLLLSGCAGPEGHIEKPPAGTAPVEATRPIVSTPSPTQGADAAQELSLSYDPAAGFNPFSCIKLANRAIMSLLYQRLFVVTAAYEAVPELAQEYTVSDDLMTHTIILNSASFTNGAALTAEDAAASLKAAQESAVYGQRLFHVASIEASDPQTLVITTGIPMEKLPLLLDIPIVPAGEVEAELPSGSGPYALRGTGASARLELKPNWTGNNPVGVKTIPLSAASSTTEIRDNFEFGDTDVVYTDPGSASYADYRCDYELYNCPTGIMLYLSCNLEEGLFTDETIRSALTYAIDREALIRDPYNGFAAAATLPADPASPFYSASLAAEYAYAPEKFTAALQKKNQTDASIKLLVNGSSAYRVRAAEEIAENLRAAGLTVEILSPTGNEYTWDIENLQFDLHLGEVRLSSTYDLSQFFRPWGDLSYGGLSDETLYDACKDALENSGNYYNLHRAVAADGRLCPVLFRSYAVYVNRGSIEGLTPGVDCIFFRGEAVSSANPKAPVTPPEETKPEETGMAETEPTET